MRLPCQVPKRIYAIWVKQEFRAEFASGFNKSRPQKAPDLHRHPGFPGQLVNSGQSLSVEATAVPDACKNRCPWKNRQDFRSLSGGGASIGSTLVRLSPRRTRKEGPGTKQAADEGSLGALERSGGSSARSDPNGGRRPRPSRPHSEPVAPRGNSSRENSGRRSPALPAPWSRILLGDSRN